MNLEEKQAALNQLGDAYRTFIAVVVSIQTGNVQKNQAILRFDEGHMWLQNGIMNYQAPVPASAPAIEPNPVDTINHESVNNDEVG